MRMAPVMTASQPTMVMTTRQSGVHTLWVSTMARPAGRVMTPDRKISAGLAMNSLAKVRNPGPWTRSASPSARANGPISLARKIEVVIDVLSLRRHDPDQVQRVTADAVSQLPVGAPLGTIYNLGR